MSLVTSSPTKLTGGHARSSLNFSSTTYSGSIREAEAGAEGVAGFVVLAQALAIARKVLHLNGRVEFLEHWHHGQVEPQIEFQADMRAGVANLQFRRELDLFIAMGIFPGQG